MHALLFLSSVLLVVLVGYLALRALRGLGDWSRRRDLQFLVLAAGRAQTLRTKASRERRQVQSASGMLSAPSRPYGLVGWGWTLPGYYWSESRHIGRRHGVRGGQGGPGIQF